MLAINGGTPVRTKELGTWPQFTDRDKNLLLEVLESRTWFTGMLGADPGTKTEQFEKLYANYHGVKHAITCVNGAQAIEMALRAAGLGKGDEVIIPGFTFIATATPVLAVGAFPVVADILAETNNIDPASVAQCITPKTKAIMPVHMAGLICDMEALQAIADKHNLIIIEDAAHATGSKRNGKFAGSFGLAGCFSFQESKTITAGEGGIITTDDDDLAFQLASLRSCGRNPDRPWYEHYRYGGNTRITEFQSAILIAQLERLPDQLKIKNENGFYLAEKINQIPGIKHTRDYGAATEIMSYYYYMIDADPAEWGVPRDRVMEAINAEGVPLGVTYAPLPATDMFQESCKGEPWYFDRSPLEIGKMKCPVTDVVTSRNMIMMHQCLLGGKSDIDDIYDAFQKVWDHRKEL
jgi:dTDP-4-amino-4,6-dideoxygalactose transaminase